MLKTRIKRAAILAAVLAGSTLVTSPNPAGAAPAGGDHGPCVEVVAAKARTAAPPVDEETTTTTEAPPVEETTTTTEAPPVEETTTTTEAEPDPDPCEPEEITPAAPDFTGECGAGTVTVPETEGASYTLDGDPLDEGVQVDLVAGDHTVTAEPDEGYVFADGAEAEWSYTVTPADAEGCAPDLVEVTPIAPTVTGECPSLLTIPAVEGVLYFVEGIESDPLVAGDYVLDDADYVIVAEAAEGYVIAEGAEAEFPVSGTPTDGCEPPGSIPTVPEPPAPSTTSTVATSSTGDLPRTGSNTGPMVAAGLGLVVVGAALVIGKRRLAG